MEMVNGLTFNYDDCTASCGIDLTSLSLHDIESLTEGCDCTPTPETNEYELSELSTYVSSSS